MIACRHELKINDDPAACDRLLADIVDQRFLFYRKRGVMDDHQIVLRWDLAAFALLLESVQADGRTAGALGSLPSCGISHQRESRDGA